MNIDFDRERAEQLYGPYLKTDPYDFNFTVENAAGRALLSAVLRVFELNMIGENAQSISDIAALEVVGKAISHGHITRQDVGFDPVE